MKCCQTAQEVITSWQPLKVCIVVIELLKRCDLCDNIVNRPPPKKYMKMIDFEECFFVRMLHLIRHVSLTEVERPHMKWPSFPQVGEAPCQTHIYTY